ncbi:MAG: TIGR00180 family glycosyltransferase [Candidatus Omnitrophica bacterium]|nr:TIGR00180 family glycosyltransferase [Candidatus Omnitrophota bacterium]
MSSTESLTVLIPTYNRHPQLLRLLRYAATVGCPYPMRVLDSSSDPLTSVELRRALEADRIRHERWAPSTPPMQKLHEGLAHVASPYVVVWADDDFLVPRALTAGVSFLDAHPDYSVVHGRSYLLTVEQVNGHGVPSRQPYGQRAITAATAGERLDDHLRGYTVLNYAIHRAERLARNVAQCVERGFGYNWGEIALGSLDAIQGKVGVLDQLYLVKEGHQGPDAWWTWLCAGAATRPSDVFDWVTEANFPSAYASFRECVAAALSQEDRLTMDEARDIVKAAFWSYAARALTEKRRAHDGMTHRDASMRWRRAARRIPGLRGIVRAVRGGKGGAEPDWLPIYQAMTTKDVEMVAA